MPRVMVVSYISPVSRSKQVVYSPPRRSFSRLFTRALKTMLASGSVETWTLNDPAGTTLAQGTAGKAQDWALVVKQEQAAQMERLVGT